MKEKPPGTHANSLIIQQGPSGVLWGIRKPTIHVLPHKVSEEHVMAHEAHPTKQLRQEQPSQHSGRRADSPPRVLGQLDHLWECGHSGRGESDRVRGISGDRV